MRDEFPGRGPDGAADGRWKDTESVSHGLTDDATRSGSFPEATPATAERRELPQERIGNYRLIERIGVGGMGEVYLAEQIEPIRRLVALKIIKLGMDTREFTVRFESERQALALMEHPNIARVFDAGATEQGRPYFVMEYCRGIPITDYCSAGNLDVRGRLALFIQVCEGIQHAHQKAIIHRDIKPSNILVMEQDGRASPRIIDFGVAKAIDHKLADRTVHTELGQIVGTPAYMSPEQAEMTGRAVDTRTDVYALGVLLYELLTDTLPFDMAEMRAAGFDGMLRMIREKEPPRPSSRLRLLGETAAAVASRRRMDPPRLNRLLKGDLDWITMRAMEKDPARRYQSVNDLLEDVRRYLQDRPVHAGPPSTAYRLRKLARRRRAAVVAAAVVVLGVVLGITGLTTGLVRAKRAERVARQEAGRASQVSGFLVGLFRVSDPSESRGNSITAREILDRGVQRIGVELQQQPLTQAQLMTTMGRVYRELGLYRQARSLLEQALATMRSRGAAADTNVAAVLDDLGHLLRETGEYGRARQCLAEALAIREKALGSNHPDVAQSLNSYANVLWQNGEHEQARGLYERALAAREQTLGRDDPLVAVTLNNLGGLLTQTGRYPEALVCFDRALAIRRAAFGEEHPDVASSLASLGRLHHLIGDYARSGDYHARALALRERLFGASHPLVAESLNDYAIVVEGTGDLEGARQMYERALAMREATLGRSHPEVSNTLSNLAAFHSRRGDSRLAVSLLERALAIMEEARGPEHADVAASLNNLAVAHMDMGDHAGAIPYLQRSLKIRERSLGPGHPEVARAHNNLGVALSSVGDPENARAHCERSVAIWEKALGPDHPDLALGLESLGNVMRQQGDYEMGRPLLERAVAIQEKALGPKHADLARCLGDLALLYYYQGRHSPAETLFTRAVAIQTANLPENHPELINNLYNLACLSALQGKREQAIDYLRQAVDRGFASAFVAEDPDLGSLHGDPGFEALVARVRARAAGA